MKKTAKKLLSLVLCLTFMLGIFTANIGSIQTEAAETQKAMFLFKNTLYVTCNAENHAYKSNYPYRKPIDIIDNLSGNGNAYAPFDCKVIAKYEGTNNGNTVAFESLEKVQFADGTVDYMTFMVAHDNDISDISVGKTYSQGAVFYQEGTKGISTGAHIHLEAARGAYSKRSSSSQSIWAFVRAQSNVVYPHNAFFLYEGTKVSNSGGYTWQIAKTTYTLTYDANGGYGAPPSQTDTYQWQISYTVPVRDGYTFLGWSESSTATSPSYEGGELIFGINSDLTLYAVWQQNHTHNYVLTDSYAATCTTDGYKVYTCSCDDSYTSITEYALGHDFSDYDIEPAHPHYSIYRCSRYGCSEISRTSETNYDSSCSQCNPATYTVSYNANGGTGAPSSQTKNHGVSLTLSNTVPTKKYTITYNANGGSVSPSSKTLNCKFIKWNTAANGSGTSYNSGATYSSNSSVTLYAQYATPTAGTLATPTRSGYTFDGWYTAASGGTKLTTSTVISKNTTVYAHWTKKAEPTTKPAVTLSSISIKTYPNKTEYNVGESFNSSGLTLTAKYSDGTSKTITSGFTCSKPDMTTAGTKKVTVTYGGKTASFNITVTASTVKATSVDIIVDQDFGDGNVAELSASVNPSNASYKSITWSSSDTSIATVDSDGTVTSHGNIGKATITVTVTNHDGTTVSDSIEVTVENTGSSGGLFGFLAAIFELLFLPFTFLFAILFG